MNLDKIKSYFLKTMIGCLVAAAAIAVVTVLSGQFNDVTSKALSTIVLIALHSLISFSFIVNNEKQKTFDSLTFFTNATFIIIILSFITSIFGLWRILGADFVGKLYALYFILLFAILHGEVLAKTLGKKDSINSVVYSNFIFMVAVVLMLLPVIFMEEPSSLGSMYYRILAATGIIDATLTLIAVILHKLYIQKHPELVDPVFNTPVAAAGQTAGTSATPAPAKGMNIFVKLLIGYIVLQIVVSIGIGLIGRI